MTGSRTLEVYCDQKRVGRLAEMPDRRIAFQREQSKVLQQYTTPQPLKKGKHIQFHERVSEMLDAAVSLEKPKPARNRTKNRNKDITI